MNYNALLSKWFDDTDVHFQADYYKFKNKKLNIVNKKNVNLCHVTTVTDKINLKEDMIAIKNYDNTNIIDILLDLGIVDNKIGYITDVKNNKVPVYHLTEDGKSLWK